MDQPIRILHVLGRLDYGGAETMLMNLYRNIDREKIQFDFVIHTEDLCKYSEEITSLGGRIYSVPRYSVKNHFKYVKSWKDFFTNHPEYNIVHGHIRSTAAIYLRVAKKKGLKAIMHSHSISSGSGLASIVKDVMQLPIRYIADDFFACSLEAGMWLFGKKVVESKRFSILKNAIDVNRFAYNEEVRKIVRSKYMIEDKYVIGHVGRFSDEKNHKFLIDLFKVIHRENKDTILMLVGDGDLKESIQNQVDELEISDSVIFTGVQSNVEELFQSMDIFVFPSKFEGLGMVVVEAQATGLQCVVSDSVPRGAKVSNLFETISLEESKEIWSEVILTTLKNSTRSPSYIRENSIDLQEYDVLETSKYLSDFYFKENSNLSEDKSLDYIG